MLFLVMKLIKKEDKMRKSILIMILLTAIMSLTAVEWPYFPKTNVIEVSVNEDNTYLNSGLNATDTMFPDDETIILKYYSSSNPLGNSDSQNMINLLGTTVFPSVYMNGSIKTKGVKPHMSDGNVFKTYAKKELFEAARLYLFNLQFNPQNGQASVMVYDAVDSQALQNMTVQYIIVENNVSGQNNVVRKVVNEALPTIAEAGELQLNKTISIDPSWNQANIKLVVMIRNNQNKIIQARSSEVIPQQKLRIVSPQPNYHMTSEAYYEFPYIGVMSTDFLSDYTMRVFTNTEPVNTPENWNFTYCDHGSCYSGPSEHNISAGSYKEFHPSVISSGEGSAIFNFLVTANGMSDLRIPYNFLKSTADVLIIDDDGIKTTETIYQSGLTFSGLNNAVVDLSIYNMETFDFSGFEHIVWNMNNPWTMVPPAQITAIKNAIEAGTHFYIAGPSVGWAFTDEQSLFKTDNSESFYTNVLDAIVSGSVNTNSNIHGFSGTIGQYALFTFIDNQFGTEIIDTPTTENSTPAFYSQTQTQLLGLQSSYGLGKVAYTTFDLSRITWNVNSPIEFFLINRIFSYFESAVSNDPVPQINDNLLKVQAYPNPFNSTTEITVSSKRQNDLANIEIFNIKGQKVNSYMLNLSNGKASFKWNGKDQNNNETSNGIYFIKASNQTHSQMHKIIRIK